MQEKLISKNIHQRKIINSSLKSTKKPLQQRIIYNKLNTFPFNNCLHSTLHHASDYQPSYLCFANVHMLIEAYKNPEFAKAVNNSTYTVADGVPLLAALRLLYGIKQERIAGMDFVPTLIKESEKLDYKDLEDGYASISRAFPAPEYTVNVVHGRMKPEEKDIAMQHFKEGRAQILVATSVIEVGVDVPNASVMVIESAERFGLSQLHQLRGRVGRGASQAYCILMTSYKLSKEGRQRIETMVRTNNGFDIAETDLKLRGPGDLMGTQQSGIVDLMISDLAKDANITGKPGKGYTNFTIRQKYGGRNY